MRYKIEDEFNVKKHTTEYGDFYSILLETSEVFVIPSSNMIEITDLGGLYLRHFNYDEGKLYHLISKDMKRTSIGNYGEVSSLLEDGLHHDISYDRGEYELLDTVSFLSSHVNNEPCQDLDSFCKLSEGKTLSLVKIDGVNYLCVNKYLYLEEG
jgi:hypothetical protein